MNQETKPCAKCGAPMKFVQAGVSKKTGKPYNAFWKCQECQFGETVQNTKPKVGGQSAEGLQLLRAINDKLDTVLRILMTPDPSQGYPEQGGHIEDNLPREPLPF